MALKKEIAEYALNEALKGIEQLVKEIKKDKLENEQFYLDFLDKLNELSIS